MLYVLLFETCIYAFSAHGERQSTLEKEKTHGTPKQNIGGQGWRPKLHFLMCKKGTKNYFLRVIPTVKHYPDIASDIPSGSIYGIFIRNIRTFYLTCILTLSPAFYLASFLAHELVLMVDAELFL